MQQACSQQQSSLGEEELGQATAFPEDTVHETLPTSTLMSLQADAQDTEPDSDSPSAATSLAPSSAAHLPGCNSTGQLSFMSDGSFVHVGDTAQADGEVSNQEEALDQEEALPPIITESVTLEHVSQQADALLDQLSEDLPEAPEAAEADAADMHAEASVEIDEARLTMYQCKEACYVCCGIVLASVSRLLCSLAQIAGFSKLIWPTSSFIRTDSGLA